MADRPTPTRRTVLASLGGTTAALAGCIGAVTDAPTGDGDTDPTPETPTPPPTPDTSPPPNVGSLETFDPAAVHASVDVGSREGVDDDFQPHGVAVWNDTDRDREIHVRVVDRIAERTAFRRGFDVPADESVALSLLEPSRYLLQAWAPALDASTALSVPCSLFDCNGSRTRVAFRPDGSVPSSVISTMAGCPSPQC